MCVCVGPSFSFSFVHFEGSFSHLRVCLLFIKYIQRAYNTEHSINVVFFILWPLRSIPIWCAPVFLANRSDCMHVYAYTHRESHIHRTLIQTNTRAVDIYNRQSRRVRARERESEHTRKNGTLSAHTSKNQTYLCIFQYIHIFLLPKKKQRTQSRAHSLSIWSVSSVLSLSVHACVLCTCARIVCGISINYQRKCKEAERTRQSTHTITTERRAKKRRTQPTNILLYL